MTEPTATHIQRACDLLNEETLEQWPDTQYLYCPHEWEYFPQLRILARQLATADAEAERVRKVAKEIVRLVYENNLIPLRGTERIVGLAKSLLPPEPVDQLLIEAREIVRSRYPEMSDDYNGRRIEITLAALKRGMELAKQSYEIKEKV